MFFQRSALPAERCPSARRFFKTLPVSPLPGIVKIGRETFLPAAFFINLAPPGILRVLRLIVGSVNIVHTAGYALKHCLDEIHYIDILDCNGGDHGYPFATNFNPEINLREVSANGSYWENGHWVETEPRFHSSQASLRS